MSAQIIRVEFIMDNGHPVSNVFTTEEQMDDMFDEIEFKFGQSYREYARITKLEIVKGEVNDVT